MNSKLDLEKTILEEGDFHSWVYVFECKIRRNELGCWCGYVIIPPTLTQLLPLKIYSKVHGGITWDRIDEFGNRILGFDASHHDDILPRSLDLLDLNEYWIDITKTYKTKEFMINQTNNMVDELCSIDSIKRSLSIDKILK